MIAEIQPCFAFADRATSPWHVIIIIHLWSMFHFTNAVMVRPLFAWWHFVEFYWLKLNCFYLELSVSLKPVSVLLVFAPQTSCCSFSPQCQWQTFESSTKSSNDVWGKAFGANKFSCVPPSIRCFLHFFRNPFTRGPLLFILSSLFNVDSKV